MNRKRKDRRSLALALLLAVGLLLPVAVSSQGLFKRSGVTDGKTCLFDVNAEETTGIYGNRNAQTTGNINDQIFGGTNGGFVNEGFGTPIGGGLLILVAAGAGYAILKRKEDKQ